jgi:hypothetical protein
MLRIDGIQAMGMPARFALRLAVFGLGGGLLACSSAAPPAASAAEAAPAEHGASTEAPSEGAPPVAAPHGKRAPCSTDQSCNDDPSVSALWGVCTEMGVCECNEGFERSPTSDLCRPVPGE